MKHLCLQPFSDHPDYPVLERWMREVATLLQGFRYYAPNYRPFEELEVANVSLLVAAAAAAGYYPIAENAVTKRSGQGRADLWFVAGKEAYSFEFKRAWNESSIHQLSTCMSLAVCDAERIDPFESEHFFAGVVAPVLSPQTVGIYETFDEADFTFTIGLDTPEVFIFLKRAR